ncbi:MAG: lyase family protein, partial [bacterium]
MDKKLWGGRFAGAADPSFEKFNSSFSFDQRLFEADIRGSIAHCNALRRAAVLTTEEAEQIVTGLQAILEEATGRDNYFDQPAEDVHSFVEARLVELI